LVFVFSYIWGANLGAKIEMGHSVRIILDKRYCKTDGRYPVKIKVYISGRKILYGTDYSLSKEDWVRMKDDQLKNKALVKIRKALDDLKKNAEAVLDDPNIRNHELFESEFFREVHRHNYKLSFWFQEYIEDLTQNNNPQSTVINYDTALNSIESFKPNLTFQDITPEFLFGYASWMKSRGRSQATTSIYLRNLRCIFNYAIHDKKIIKEDIYPFGKNKYPIKSKTKMKQSLQYEQIKQIAEFVCPENGSVDFARDMWIFHYLLNGSNTKDVCRLKYSDLDFENKIFSFYRAKTEETELEISPISGFLHDKAIQIIEKWGNPKRDSFVFPFFNEFSNVNFIDSKRERTIIVFLRRRINRNLKTIQQELNLPIKLTIAIARHSFARLSTNYKIEEISDQMGHQSTKTTQNYIGSMDFDKKKEMTESLL